MRKNCKLRTNEKKVEKTENLTSWKNQNGKIKLRFDELKKLKTIASNENLKRKITI